MIQMNQESQVITILIPVQDFPDEGAANDSKQVAKTISTAGLPHVYVHANTMYVLPKPPCPCDLLADFALRARNAQNNKKVMKEESKKTQSDSSTVGAAILKL